MQQVLFPCQDKKAKVRGSYSVDLRDIPYILDVGKVKFKRGTTRGVIELEGDKTSGYGSPEPGRWMMQTCVLAENICPCPRILSIYR